MGSDLKDTISIVTFGLMLLFSVLIAFVITFGFLAYKWTAIYKAEGGRVIFWLFVTTLIISIPCMILAADGYAAALQMVEANRGTLSGFFGNLVFAILLIFVMTAPTFSHMIYRFFVPISPIRSNAIEAVRMAYQRGKITRKECNRRVTELQRMREEKLEAMFLVGEHNPMPSTMPPSVPAPRQQPAPRAHPREAFDIPDR